MNNPWNSGFGITSAVMGFADGISAKKKNLPANAGDVRDTGLILGLRRSPERGLGNPLQYSCLRIPWTEEPGWSLQSMGLQRVRHD